MNILIADDEIDIAEIIDFVVQDKFPKGTNTFLVKNSAEAIDILKTENIDYVISDHNMPGGNGHEILAYIISNKLSTKHIICSTLTVNEAPELYPAAHVFFQISKPAILEGVKALAAKVNNLNANVNKDLEPDYVPITLQFLKILGKAPSDLYIQISEEKFIKCINQNESFTEEDNFKYLSKSIKNLCIKKPYDESIMNSLVNLALDNIMKKETLSLHDKMTITHEQIFKFITFTNISEDIKKATRNNVTQVTSLMIKNNIINNFWKNITLIGEYPSQLYTLQSTLAALLVRNLSWSSEATMYKLTMAAFMQDVSIKSIKVMKIYDHAHFLNIQSTLNDSEIKNFLEHPEKSSNIVKTFKEIPPDIDKIILEQNEMPDGSGFPRKLNSNAISPLSCLFILSGLMARHILADGDNFNIKDFVLKIEEQGYSRGNFKEIFNIIKNM